MDLHAVVQHYKQKCRPRAQAELDSFRSEATLEAAIRRAALAITPDGSRYSHQRRRNRADLERAAERLLACASAISDATNFARLLEVVNKAVGHLDDLGDLYVYDTALRIGAKTGKLPTRIYLHSGTRDGARKLGIDVKGRKVLDLFELPPPFRELEPHESEDVLCIYKDVFGTGTGKIDDITICWPEDYELSASSTD